MSEQYPFRGQNPVGYADTQHQLQLNEDEALYMDIEALYTLDANLQQNSAVAQRRRNQRKIDESTLSPNNSDSISSGVSREVPHSASYFNGPNEVVANQLNTIEQAFCIGHRQQQMSSMNADDLGSILNSNIFQVSQPFVHRHISHSIVQNPVTGVTDMGSTNRAGESDANNPSLVLDGVLHNMLRQIKEETAPNLEESDIISGVTASALAAHRELPYQVSNHQAFGRHLSRLAQMCNMHISVVLERFRTLARSQNTDLDPRLSSHAPQSTNGKSLSVRPSPKALISGHESEALTNHLLKVLKGDCKRINRKGDVSKGTSKKVAPNSSSKHRKKKGRHVHWCLFDCGATFESTSQLVRHILRRDPDVLYRPKACSGLNHSQYFKYLSDAVQHLFDIKEHEEFQRGTPEAKQRALSDVEARAIVTRPWVCPFKGCNRSSVSHRGFYDHVGDHQRRDGYTPRHLKGSFRQMLLQLLAQNRFRFWKPSIEDAMNSQINEESDDDDDDGSGNSGPGFDAHSGGNRHTGDYSGGASDGDHSDGHASNLTGLFGGRDDAFGGPSGYSGRSSNVCALPKSPEVPLLSVGRHFPASSENDALMSSMDNVYDFVREPEVLPYRPGHHNALSFRAESPIESSDDPDGIPGMATAAAKVASESISAASSVDDSFKFSPQSSFNSDMSISDIDPTGDAPKSNSLGKAIESRSMLSRKNGNADDLRFTSEPRSIRSKDRVLVLRGKVVKSDTAAS